MPLSDTKLTDWSVTPADNSPAGSEIINGGLDDQLRLIKAIVRSQSLDKQWVDPNLIASYKTSGSFYVDGNVGGTQGTGAWVSKNRKVKITHANPNHNPFVGYITGWSYDSGTSKTTVYVEPDIPFTPIQSDIDKVYIGAQEALANSIPNNYLRVDLPAMYTSTVGLVSGTTNRYNVTFSAIETNLSEGQTYYIRFPATNAGPVWLKFNNATWEYEVKKVNYTSWSAAGVPTPQFAPLSAGDIAAGQVIAVTYYGAGPWFQLMSPLAGTISLVDMATSYFVVKHDASSYDTTNCVSGGYLTLMGAYALEWCLVKEIPWASGFTHGSRTVTLPLGNKTGSLLSVSVTPVDITANLQLYVNTVTASNGQQIQIFNPNASTAGSGAGIPCYVIAIAKLA